MKRKREGQVDPEEAQGSYRRQAPENRYSQKDADCGDNKLKTHTRRLNSQYGWVLPLDMQQPVYRIRLRNHGLSDKKNGDSC